MNEKESLSERFESFMGGKGFYIVLFAAIAVIGITAWLLVSPAEIANENYGDITMSAAETLPDRPEQTQASTAEKPESGSAVKPQPEKTAPVMNPVEVPIEEETKPAEPEKPAEKTEKTENTEKPAEAVQEGALEEKSENAAAELSFTIPVAGPVTVPYSYDGLIYSKTMHDWRTHDGIDIEAPIGTKVKAVAQGSVLSVEQDDLLGTVVTIDHGDGIVSVYANLAAVPTVKAGDAVTMGSVIGSVGDTALGETGEVQHLHFAMMKDGTPVDPYKYIPQR